MMIGQIVKKFYLVALIIITFTTISHSASKTYTKGALAGGGPGALDSIDGNDINEGDRAIVFTGTDFYSFHLDAGSGAAENVPFVITPDSNAGNKRWLKMSLDGIDATQAEIDNICDGNGVDNSGHWMQILANAFETVNSSYTLTDLVHNLEASAIQLNYICDGVQSTSVKIYDLANHLDADANEIDIMCDSNGVDNSGYYMIGLAASFESAGGSSTLMDLNANLDASATQLNYICDGVQATSVKIYELANHLDASANEIDFVCDSNGVDNSGYYMIGLASSFEAVGGAAKLIELNTNLDANSSEIDNICEDLGVGSSGYYMQGLANNFQAESSSAKLIELNSSLTASAVEVNTICDGITATAEEVNRVCDKAVSGHTTWDCPSLPSLTMQSTTLTVDSATAAHGYTVSVLAGQSELIASASYDSINTVKITLFNMSAGTIDPILGFYYVIGIRD